jgi:hypothetical protein
VQDGNPSPACGQRKLLLAGRPAGLALAELWYLGKNEVTVETIEKIRRKLSPTEFKVLKSVMSAMPTWMSDASNDIYTLASIAALHRALDMGLSAVLV